MNRRKSLEGNKKNLCRAFILPMCGINYITLPNNFINCYITLNQDVVLIFDKTEEYDIVFYRFLEHVKNNLKSYNSYEEDVDEIIIFLKIPEIFKEDYNLFIEGKYSKFSQGYKDILTSFYGIKINKNDYRAKVHDAIYPQDYKRKQIALNLSTEQSPIDWTLIKEVLDKPNLNRELYKPLTIILAENIQP